MDAELLRRLVCPSCASELSFEALEEGGDGLVLCGACRVWYPVRNQVPVLLTFPTPFHEGFAALHQGELARRSEYGPPRGRPRPGEESVQQTFTEEWGTVSESELSFHYSPEDLVDLNREVWLGWIGRDGSSPPASVLDVGCGLGHETVALSRAVEGAEVVGIDSNFAVLDGATRLRGKGMHFVLASLFDLPFRAASFDLVYSQGVLHHTFSTNAAFREISRFVADGGHLFVWLYALEDRLGATGRRAVVRRTTYAVEFVLRPLLSRSPAPVRDGFFDVATRALHPILRPRMRHTERWEPRDTEARIRDWLSPRFAHRHAWNEVIEWFEDLGFGIVDVQSPRNYRRLFDERLWGVGLTGRRQAAAEAAPAS